MSTWTIKRAGGEERTMAAWGIANLTRVLQNLDEDYCTVSMSAASVVERIPFEVGERVVVYRDGVQWFVGQVAAERPTAEGTREGLTFRIHGPGWWLNRLIYRQMWRYTKWPIQFRGTLPVTPPDPDNIWDTTGLTAEQVETQMSVLRDPRNYETEETLSSVCILGQDDGGEFVDTRDSVLAVLNYAIAQGAPFQVGTVAAGVQMPYDQIRDLTCYQVIRRLVQWTPDQGSWFDYTTTPPTFHLQPRAARTGVTFAPGEADPVEVCELVARDDLRVTGVTLNYLRRSTRVGMTMLSMERDSVGATDGMGVLYATIDLNGSAMMDGAGKIYRDGEPLPVGVAQSLFDAYGELLWEGRVVLAREEIDGVNYMARVINISGERTEWETMAAPVQSQTDDVVSGRTTLQLGPPAHLSPQDFVMRLQAARGLRPVSIEESTSRIDGGFSSPNQPVPAPGVTPQMLFGGVKLDGILTNHLRGFRSSSGSGTQQILEFFVTLHGAAIHPPEQFRNGGIWPISGVRQSYKFGVVSRRVSADGKCPSPAVVQRNLREQEDGSLAPALFTFPALPCP